MKPEDIRSLWIRYNEEDNTYSIDIDTPSYSVSFPKTQIQFTCADNMAFPFSVVVLDDNNNAVNNYSLTAKPAQPKEEQPMQEEQSIQGN